MKAGAFASATVWNTGCEEIVPEISINGADIIEATIGRREKVVTAEPGYQGVGTVIPHVFQHGIGNANHAVFIPFGTENRHHSHIQIHIGYFQPQGFGSPQSACVDQSEKDGHDQMPNRGGRCWLRGICGRKQPFKLVFRKNVRHELLGFLRRGMEGPGNFIAIVIEVFAELAYIGYTNELSGFVFMRALFLP